MKKVCQLFGAILSMWLAGGCSARSAIHRAIPNCISAQAYVPGECYSVVVAGKLEVRCPGSTTTYTCGKN